MLLTGCRWEVIQKCCGRIFITNVLTCQGIRPKYRGNSAKLDG